MKVSVGHHRHRSWQVLPLLDLDLLGKPLPYIELLPVARDEHHPAPLKHHARERLAF